MQIPHTVVRSVLGEVLSGGSHDTVKADANELWLQDIYAPPGLGHVD